MRKLRLLVIAAIAIFAVSSCLDGGSSYKYTTGISFEYQIPDSVIFKNGATHVALKTFIYGEMAFESIRDEKDSTEVLGGFAYAHLQDSVFTATPEMELPDPYIVFDNDSTNLGRNHFMVYRHNDDPTKNPKEAITYIYSENGTCTPKLLFVANTLLSVVRAESAFEASDWAKVKFTGYNKGSKTGEVTADLFSNGKPIRKWTKVNLEPLSKVDAMSIEITASKSGIVDACCIDMILAEILVEYK